MGTVDYWCNVFTESGIRRMFRETPEIAEVVEWWGMESRLVGRDVPAFVAHLDELDIDSVLVPAIRMASHQTGQLLWDIKEREVHDIAQAAPGRIFGLAGIDPRSGTDGLQRLEYWVKNGPFVGAHLHPYGFGLPVNHRRLYPFYAKCVELDIPVVMQVGHSAERMPSSMARPLLLDDVALDFPDLVLIGAHTGWPWVEELIALAWKHPNVYIGTSAHHPKYWDPSLVRFLNTRGQGKVLFGTDWPVVDHPDALHAIDELNLEDPARSMLMGRTARRLFAIP